jgi:hypothetical protein
MVEQNQISEIASMLGSMTKASASNSYGMQFLFAGFQDAEYLDPVLNHVPNKEYQKTGGRVLIQLGKQKIDFSHNSHTTVGVLQSLTKGQNSV